MQLHPAAKDLLFPWAGNGVVSCRNGVTNGFITPFPSQNHPTHHPSSPLQRPRVERQRPQPLPRRREDRIRHRWRDRRRPWLADATRRFAAFDDVNLHRRHLGHAQHRVVVEVALFDPPVGVADAAVERRRQPEGDRAFDLAPDDGRVDRHAAIDCRDDPVNLGRTVRRESVAAHLT